MAEKVKKESKFKKFISSEFVVYIFFGVLTTAISWISYAIFELILPDMGIIDMFKKQVEVKIVIANVISWVIAFIFAFVVNKLFVFKSKSWELKTSGKEFWQFFLARFGTGFIEWLGMPLLVAMGLNQELTIPIINKSIHGIWAKIITSVIVVLLNYIFSKFIIFNRKKDK